MEIATRDAIDHEFLNSQQYREKYPNRVVPQEEIEEFSKIARKQATQIRRALAQGIFWTFATMAIGVVAGVMLTRWVGPPSKFVIYALQAAGAAVILGATLGEIGRNIETFDANTLPERVNTWLFKRLYIVGTFLFFMSFSWDVMQDAGIPST